MKKLSCIFTALILSLFLASCVNERIGNKNQKQTLNKESIIVGFVYAGKACDGGFNESLERGRIVLEQNGISTMYCENIREPEDLKRCLKELIRLGVTLIYTVNYENVSPIMDVAMDYPYVKFSHCSEAFGAENVSSFNGKIHEAYYIAGCAAGLNTMSGKIGLVAPFRNHEGCRTVNAYAAGARSVNPDAEVYVAWTGSHDNPKEEKKLANSLADKGCDVLSHAQNGQTVVGVAQDRGITAIGFNSLPNSRAPKSWLTSVCLCWDKFILDDVNRYIEGNWISRNYCEGIDEGVVDIQPPSSLSVPFTKDVMESARKKILEDRDIMFRDCLRDNKGNERLVSGNSFSLSDLMNMNWVAEGISEIN